MFDKAFIHAEDISLDASFGLTDKKGIHAAKMKTVLSGISRSGNIDDIGEFMSKVDDDVNQMSSLSLPSNSSTLAQVLKATKAIMDQFSQVVHLPSIIVHQLIEVIRYTRYSMHRGPLSPVFTT